MDLFKTSTVMASSGRVAGVMLAAAIAGGAAAPQVAQARAQSSMAPTIQIFPEVMQPDGTDRTYNTPNGPSIWTDNLPVVQGDKIKLNVFVATGASDLSQVIIRLDNQRLATLQTAPWHTVLDTTKMEPGYHNIEVFAQPKGSKQSYSQTRSFFVTTSLATQYIIPPNTKVGAYQQASGGPEIDTSHGDAIPDVPAFITDKALDPQAQVMVYARSWKQTPDPSETGGIPVNGATANINGPTVFVAEATPGSTADHYAYALVRNGALIQESQQPLELRYNEILIQKRDATTAGLGTGTVTMYVWGIDKQNRASAPVKTQIVIP